jgi:EmrB/QacA subfamily drug resistance transporter
MHGTTYTKREIRVIIGGVMLAMLLASLDQTIIATALATIAGELGDVALISWIVTAYLLSSTCGTLITGKLSDLYGRRLVLMWGLTIFLVGSIACALSGSMLTLIAARILQGLGGGTLISTSQAAIADVVAPRERGRYSAYFAMVFASSAVAGPVAGGILTHHFGWQSIFWINLPLGLLALSVIWFALRKLPGRRSDASIDYAGVALFTVCATSFLLGVTWGGVQYGWGDWQLVLAYATAIVSGAVFLHRQTRVAHPILPLKFFSDDVVGRALVAVFFVYGTYLLTIVMTPVFMQVVLDVAVNQVGVLMIPMTIGTPVGAAINGRVARNTGRYKIVPLITLPIAVAGLVAVAFGIRDLTALQVSLILTTVGLGVGPVFSSTTLATQNAVQRRDLGAVTGSVAFFRALGGAVIVAAASALVLGLTTRWIHGLHGMGSLEDLVREQLSGEQRQTMIEIFRVLFLSAAGTMALGWLIFLRVAERPLSDRRDEAD